MRWRPVTPQCLFSFLGFGFVGRTRFAVTSRMRYAVPNGEDPDHGYRCTFTDLHHAVPYHGHWCTSRPWPLVHLRRPPLYRTMPYQPPMATGAPSQTSAMPYHTIPAAHGHWCIFTDLRHTVPWPLVHLRRPLPIYAVQSNRARVPECV